MSAGLERLALGMIIRPDVTQISLVGFDTEFPDSRMGMAVEF